MKFFLYYSVEKFVYFNKLDKTNITGQLSFLSIKIKKILTNSRQKMTKRQKMLKPLMSKTVTLAKSIFVFLIIAVFLRDQLVEARKHHLEVRVSFFSKKKCK